MVGVGGQEIEQGFREGLKLLQWEGGLAFLAALGHLVSIRLPQQAPRNCSQQRRGLTNGRGGLLHASTP